jgi:hypothetical protein
MDLSKEDGKTDANLTVIVVLLAVIVLCLAILGGLLLRALDEVGYESEEHRKLKDICMLEKEIGCEVKFRPYIEYTTE